MGKQTAADIAAKLKEIVGAEHVSTSDLDLFCYSRDMAPLPDDLLKTYGLKLPDAIAQPQSPEEVAAIMKWASDDRRNMTTRLSERSWITGAKARRSRTSRSRWAFR